ncbi:histidine kinase [Micromonospora sp. NPDC051296]|uniref:sensor histidine kinase n=1 Tax=Micromonospora sp. NPDC051296 TaxID=3155046 RepID=UPI00341D5532
MTEHRDLRRLGRDTALAALVAVSVCTVTALAEEPASLPVGPAGWILGIVLGGLQFARRRHPLAVLLVSTAAVVVYHMVGYPAIGTAWPLLLPFLVAAAGGYLRHAVLLAVALLVGNVGWRILVEDEWPLGVLVGEAQSLVVVGLALAVGEAVWQRRRWAEEVRLRLARADEEARQEAERRLAEQRLAVAADLHDVAAHSLVVIGLQLRLAEETVAAEPDACRAAIGAALAAHDEAVRETSRTVRLLRDAAPAPLRPAPTLVDLGRLPEVAQRAGLDLRLDLDGVRDVPASVAQAVYRIAQEALTNTLKHAGAARASLTLRREGGSLHLRFADPGNEDAGRSRSPGRNASGSANPGQDALEPLVPGQAGPLASGGHGIAGMRERVGSLGGRLEVGPDGGGGFRVDAWLPVGDT